MNDSELIKFHKVKEENLLDKKNVESFYPGIKISKGNTTGEKCIIVGVAKKESKINLNKEDLIPESINGIKTDVIEVPQMFAFDYCGAGSGSSSPSEVHPYGCPGHTYNSSGNPFSCIEGGISIGPENDNSAGTLGVSLESSSGEVLGLTNNHVLGPQVYVPSSQPDINYLVSSEIDPSDGLSKFRFLNTDTNFSILNPSFDDIELPRIEAGRKYTFTGNSTLNINYFFISTFGGNDISSAQGSAYTNVTIKDSTGQIIYQNGSNFGGSSRNYPYLKSGETLEFVYQNLNLENNKPLYYQCWDNSNMGNNFQIMFFGSPYCLTTDQSTNYTNAYEDANLVDFNKNIIGSSSVTPSNIDRNQNGGSGQNNIGSVSNVQGIKFTHESNSTSKGNHGFAPVNKIDAATISFGSNIYPVNKIKDLLDGPFTISSAEIGKKVYKSGRTTGVTPENGISNSNSSSIVSTTWSGLVHFCKSTYEDSSGQSQSVVSSQHTARFEDCIYYYGEGSWFSDSGDSGSSIIMENSGSYDLIGLHFAGFTSSVPVVESSHAVTIKSHGLACKISNIQSEFNLSSWDGSRTINKKHLDGKGSIRICNDCYEVSDTPPAPVIPEGSLYPITPLDSKVFFTGSDCIEDIYPTPSQTSTLTNTQTETQSHTSTLTNTRTETQSHTSTLTNTRTETQSHTSTLTNTETSTLTNTQTDTESHTSTETQTETFTPVTETQSQTSTLTNTETSTLTNTQTDTESHTSTLTNTETATESHTSTETETETRTPITPTETETALPIDSILQSIRSTVRVDDPNVQFGKGLGHANSGGTAINEAGDRMATLVSYTGSSATRMHVYNKVNNNWILTHDMTIPQSELYSGSSGTGKLAMSRDGTRILLANDTANGTMQLYTYNSGTDEWLATGALRESASTTNNTHYFHSMDINDAGDRVIAGTDRNITGAYTYEYDYSLERWNTLGTHSIVNGALGKFTTPGSNSPKFNGDVVRMNGDGTVVSTSDGSNTIHVYELDAQNVWQIRSGPTTGPNAADSLGTPAQIDWRKWWENSNPGKTAGTGPHSGDHHMLSHSGDVLVIGAHQNDAVMSEYPDGSQRYAPLGAIVVLKWSSSAQEWTDITDYNIMSGRYIWNQEAQNSTPTSTETYGTAPDQHQYKPFFTDPTMEPDEGKSYNYGYRFAFSHNDTRLYVSTFVDQLANYTGRKSFITVYDYNTSAETWSIAGRIYAPEVDSTFGTAIYPSSGGATNTILIGTRTTIVNKAVRSRGGSQLNVCDITSPTPFSTVTTYDATVTDVYRLTPGSNVNRAYYLVGYDRDGDILPAERTNATIRIKVGDTINFNLSNIPNSHPFYIKDTLNGPNVSSPAATGQGSTGNGTVSWTPNTVGTYKYQCGVHSVMNGDIVVYS